MKRFKLLVVVLFLFLCGNLLNALNVGDQAPDLKISKWINGGPVSLNDQSKKIYVVFFWSAHNNLTPNLVNFVSTEKKIYGKGGAVFVGITKDNPESVNQFLKKQQNADFTIGIDDSSETFSSYMLEAKGTPIFFVIDRNRKLIWEGGPFEVDRVLAHAINGTFNIEEQKQIERYRKDIRKASNMLNRKEEVFYARKILNIDPTDRVAMNIIIDNFIINSKENEAIGFIRSAIAKANGNKYIKRALYFLELSVIRGANPAFAKKNITELISNYKTTFKADADALNSLTIVLIRDFPLAVVPIAEMMDISKKAVALSKNTKDAELFSSCLQSQARVYYLIGMLDKAISLQENAVQLIRNGSEKTAAVLVEAYYKEALMLNKKNRT